MRNTVILTALFLSACSEMTPFSEELPRFDPSKLYAAPKQESPEEIQSILKKDQITLDEIAARRPTHLSLDDQRVRSQRRDYLVPLGGCQRGVPGRARFVPVPGDVGGGLAGAGDQKRQRFSVPERCGLLTFALEVANGDR